MQLNIQLVSLLTIIAAGQCVRGAEVPSTKGGGEDGLWQAYERAIYSLDHSGDGAYRGDNVRQKLSVEFHRSEIRLSHPDGDVSFHLAGYGYGKVLPEPADATLAGSGNRVEYRRGELTEWYVNEAGGVEQGFTLTERPAHADGGPLAIELAVNGLEPVPAGEQIELRRNGRAVLRYTGLRAWDSAGHTLNARMTAASGRIRMEVADSSAVYPITIDPWVLQQELTSSDIAPGDQFGYSVAVDGDTAVIGAWLENSDHGAAYVFVRSGTTWTQQAKLTASDGASGDNFGESVSVNGNTGVVGAPSKGAAYVFVRSGTTWTQQQELTGGMQFGSSVSVSGDTAVVGGNGAYVFVRSGNTWSQQQQLTASDESNNACLGSSVAVDVSSESAVAGDLCKGAAYLFTRSGNTWTQSTEFQGDTDSVNFGESVGVSGNTIVVGDPEGGAGNGAAWVFVGPGPSYQITKLEPSDLASGATLGAMFGNSVSVSGGTVVVGAPQQGLIQNGNSDRGSAYIFTGSGNSWTQQAELTPSDVASGAWFGQSVSVSGETAVVGGYAVSSHGAAYVFVLQTTTAVTITSSPATGLSFSVSGTGCAAGSYSTPQTLQWDNSASCQVTFTSPQTAGVGAQYVFTTWADGGITANPRTITTPGSATTYTADFKTQYLLSTSVSPAGSGTVMGAGYYDANTNAPVSATANTGYQFVNWTGPVASSTSASTTVSMTGAESVTANFVAVVPVTITSSPATGLSFSVSGTGCAAGTYTTPQMLTWVQSASCQVTFSTPQSGGAGTQYVFTTWADGGITSNPRTIIAPMSTTTYTADFKTQYLLTVSASPTGGGNVTGGGYYDVNAMANVSATANTGYQFLNWTGPVASSTSASTTVTMSAPESVTANFVLPPSIHKSFGAAMLEYETQTTLTFQIDNPAGNVMSMSGIAFTDTLPPGLVVATPNGLSGSCGGGTITAVEGSNSISLSGAELSPGDSCTFSVDVTGAATGDQDNTTSNITAFGGAIVGNVGEDSLSVCGNLHDLSSWWYWYALGLCPAGL